MQRDISHIPLEVVLDNWELEYSQLGRVDFVCVRPYSSSLRLHVYARRACVTLVALLALWAIRAQNREVLKLSRSVLRAQQHGLFLRPVGIRHTSRSRRGVHLGLDTPGIELFRLGPCPGRALISHPRFLIFLTVAYCMYYTLWLISRLLCDDYVRSIDRPTMPSVTTTCPRASGTPAHSSILGSTSLLSRGGRHASLQLTKTLTFRPQMLY
ncbi:hypothetical protein EDB84DRAFT_517215 [Lactarius hengduanensis]|nr:hypothetical protein EDB84DRAFT_517215 [Lactarius hengduanensis]